MKVHDIRFGILSKGFSVNELMNSKCVEWIVNGLHRGILPKHYKLGVHGVEGWTPYPTQTIHTGARSTSFLTMGFSEAQRQAPDAGLDAQ